VRRACGDEPELAAQRLVLTDPCGDPDCQHKVVVVPLAPCPVGVGTGGRDPDPEREQLAASRLLSYLDS
jgi:hypothetical protein